MNDLIAAGRAPKIIVVENVCGAITSHQGQDFAAICNVFSSAGYRYGALVIDAKYFLPQSRPRLFIVGVLADIPLPRRLISKKPSELWHSIALQKAYNALPFEARSSWLWWNLPKPPKRRMRFADLIENDPKGVSWYTPAQTERLLSMMSEETRQG